MDNKQTELQQKKLEYEIQLLKLQIQLYEKLNELHTAISPFNNPDTTSTYPMDYFSHPDMENNRN